MSVCFPLGYQTESAEKLRATVAGDSQVRIFDIGDLRIPSSRSAVGNETLYNTHESCVQVLRCHDARVKRIVTEQSPDLFLTVAEVTYAYPAHGLRAKYCIQDGTVRQHDLRAPRHTCSSAACPPPLVKLPHDLSTLALSPLTPYQFVVAGEAPYVRIALASWPSVVPSDHRRAIYLIEDKRDVLYRNSGVCPHAVMI